MSGLHFLYALDNNYAPYCGVSITSLFENNKHLDDLVVHVMGDKISEINLQKYNQLAEQYGRKIHVYDAALIAKRIQDLGMFKYRGSYATNFRLFFADVVNINCDRLLYLDSDTIVVDDLSPLLTFDFDGKPCAAVMESLAQRYKKLIDFAPSDNYFNAGVLFINLPVWKTQNCSEQLINYLENVSAKLVNNDQDVINIALKGNIAVLSPKYNYQPIHYAYSLKDYTAVYKPQGYYNNEELIESNNTPCILHIYRFIGQFPWHINNLHPNNEQFDFYIKKSLWCDYEKIKANLSFVMKIERVLYKVLPKRAFLYLFAIAQDILFSKMKRDISKSK